MLLHQFETFLVDTVLTTRWSIVDNDGEAECSFTESQILYRDQVVPCILQFDKLKDKLQLTLIKDDKMLAVLVYDRRQQRWFGRSTAGGYIQITATSNQHIWRELSDTRKFMKGNVPAKDMGIQYADNINVDYHVPQYDIRVDFPDFDKTIHTDSCIAIIACDRLEYFTKCVQALAQNPEFAEWPVFLFLDMPTDVSRNMESAEQIIVLKELCPNAHIICRPCNFGVGKNIIDARRQLFDNLHFDYVFIIEDDVVVAPNYFETMTNLWSWLVKNQYKDNVGVVQGWQHNVTKDPSSYVGISLDSLWAYSMSKECWDDIKGLVYEYESKFLFCRYHERPHRTIGKFWESVKSMTRNGYPLTDSQVNVLRGYMGSIQTTQEWAVLIAMYKRGWLRLSPKINLAENIGRSGVGKPLDYDNMKYAKVKVQLLETFVEFEELL